MMFRYLSLIALTLCQVRTGFSLTCLHCTDIVSCKGNTTKTIECLMTVDVCYTVYNPETEGVIERACGTPTVCGNFALCTTCNVDRCHSSVGIINLPSIAIISMATVIVLNLL